MIEFQIKLIPFPKGKVHESVTINEDGSYTIFIDEALTNEQQYKHFSHAYKHITGHDFEKDNADKIEASCHYDFSNEICPAI